MTVEELLELGLDEGQAGIIAQAQEEEVIKQKSEFEEKEYGYVLDRHLSGVAFSCASAKKAFALGIKEQELKVENGEICGFGEYLEKYRQEDPGAFEKAVSGNALLVSAAAPAKGKGALNALRSAFGLEVQ